MTLNNLIDQLHDLAVNGRINGERFSKPRLANMIRSSFRPETQLKLGNRLAMTIQLPDGEWLMTVSRWSTKPDGWAYWIPETREQEARLWSELTA